MTGLLLLSGENLPYMATYYEDMGWGTWTGIPTREKLHKLEIGWVTDVL